MRNDIFMEAYAHKICDFNHNHKLRERVLKYLPMTHLYIDQAINEWHKDVVDKLPLIREKYSDIPLVLEILKEFEGTFLFPGS